MSNKSKAHPGAAPGTGSTQFQTGYNSNLEPRPITLVFRRGSAIAESFWSVEDATIMAAGLLKFVEIAKRERAKRQVQMPRDEYFRSL